MLEWYKELYVGENARKNVSKVQRKLNHGKFHKGMFLITYASNPQNLLEIIGTEQLVQKTVYRRCPMIVGIAADRDEALLLVQQIVEETYAKQKDADVRRYLNERLKENKN